MYKECGGKDKKGAWSNLEMCVWSSPDSQPHFQIRTAIDTTLHWQGWWCMFHLVVNDMSRQQSKANERFNDSEIDNKSRSFV